MINYEVITGDTYATLKRLVEDPQHKAKYRLIVTSPPYYGHRHYGEDLEEIGQERTSKEYLMKLTRIFDLCKELLTNDGSMWIVIGDTRRRSGKLLIPHRLAIQLLDLGYTMRDDIIWYKKNNISSISKENFSQAYEYILFISKNEKSYTNIDNIRVKGNEAREGRNKVPPNHLVQYEPFTQDRKKN